MKFVAASTALALAGHAGLASAAYSIQQNLQPSNFFSAFNFITADDPTHGFVNYVDQTTAQSQGLISTANNKIYMGVDYKTTNPGGRGRNSVRIESKTTYTRGLVLLDLNHMPGSVCGSWPAFWSYGTNWPTQGEIDIVEGVNSQSANWVTLHTSLNAHGTCYASSQSSTPGGYTGTLASSNCAYNSNDGSNAAGCSIHSSDTRTYGNGLNQAGGGIYAQEWTSSYIKVWFFPRGSIPGDISLGRPNPSKWGTPMANFPSGNNCNLNANIMNQMITFDTTFCGDWAGNQDVWNNDPVCKPSSSGYSSCTAYVRANPGAFQQTYWEINSLKVYQDPTLPTSSSEADGGVRDTGANPSIPVPKPGDPNWGVSPNGGVGLTASHPKFVRALNNRRRMHAHMHGRRASKMI